MPHRIIIAEATGTIPDTGQTDPCLYVGTQSGTTLTGEPPTETLPPWMQAANPVPRFDLMPPTVFRNKARARKKRWQTVKKLIREGHTVYGAKYGKLPEYSLYVIELCPAARHPEDAPLPLYVGQTSKSIEERFREHKKGGKRASGKVFRRGRCLRPDLILDRQRYYFQDDAIKAETRLGIRLQKRGHRIYGPQNMPSPPQTRHSTSKGE